jgi:hypothetical protein
MHAYIVLGQIFYSVKLFVEYCFYRFMTSSVLCFKYSTHCKFVVGVVRFLEFECSGTWSKLTMVCICMYEKITRTVLLNFTGKWHKKCKKNVTRSARSYPTEIMGVDCLNQWLKVILAFRRH